nr:hypothetical protein [Bacillus altitudinis]
MESLKRKGKMREEREGEGGFMKWRRMGSILIEGEWGKMWSGLEGEKMVRLR